MTQCKGVLPSEVHLQNMSRQHAGCLTGSPNRCHLPDGLRGGERAAGAECDLRAAALVLSRQQPERSSHDFCASLLEGRRGSTRAAPGASGAGEGGRRRPRLHAGVALSEFLLWVMGSDGVDSVGLSAFQLRTHGARGRRMPNFAQDGAAGSSRRRQASRMRRSSRPACGRLAKPESRQSITLHCAHGSGQSFRARVDAHVFEPD